MNISFEDLQRAMRLVTVLWNALVFYAQTDVGGAEIDGLIADLVDDGQLNNSAGSRGATGQPGNVGRPVQPAEGSEGEQPDQAQPSRRATRG